MSCLGLHLPPARKAWRSFTSKLQTRLHKLHRSKPLKRSITTHKPKPSKVARSSSSLYQQHQRRQQKKGCFIISPPSLSLPFRRLVKAKRPAPVYIDKLYKEPVTNLVEYKNPPGKSAVKVLDSGAGTSKHSVKVLEKTGMEADDTAWETLGLASPQMTGIDDRAEIFIAKFRAEMNRQESMARGNL